MSCQPKRQPAAYDDARCRYGDPDHREHRIGSSSCSARKRGRPAHTCPRIVSWRVIGCRPRSGHPSVVLRGGKPGDNRGGSSVPNRSCRSPCTSNEVALRHLAATVQQSQCPRRSRRGSRSAGQSLWSVRRRGTARSNGPGSAIFVGTTCAIRGQAGTAERHAVVRLAGTRWLVVDGDGATSCAPGCRSLDAVCGPVGYVSRRDRRSRGHKIVTPRKSERPASLQAHDCLVAGAGFEPATFGL